MRIAAIDIGGTAIKFGAADGCGNVAELGECPTEAKRDGGQGVVRKVLDILSSLAPFDRVGISTGGVVNAADGSIFYANENIPGYTGTQLRTLVQEQYPVPVAGLNNVHAAAWGPAQSGAGRGASGVRWLTSVAGVGGAVFAHGGLVTGKHGASGHLGHIIIHDGGKLCGCGGHGCYEAYASVTALCALVQERVGETLDGRQIFARMDGEPELAHAVSDWTDEVVTGLVSLIQAFDPERVILGGGIFNESRLMEDLLIRLRGRVMPLFRDIQVVRAALGNRAGLLGAAYAASIVK